MTKKPEIGKTYIVDHSRKGRWTASLVAIIGEDTKDVWYSLSDTPDEYINASLCTLTEVKP